jgi:hypothetical protein
MPQRFKSFGGRTKPSHVLFIAVLVAMMVAPFAVAQGGDARVESSDDRYAFLARNTNQGDGGAGAFACRSDVNPPGQTNREPCLNMVNSGTGFAAAFRTRGLTGFRLQTSGSGTATPFLLDSNATGKVNHLNADQVDGLSEEQLRALFARINADGSGATVGGGANGVTAVSRQSAGRYQVTFNRDISQCALQGTSATVADAFIVSAAPLAGNNNVADVSVRNNEDGAAVDSPFYITADC